MSQDSRSRPIVFGVRVAALVALASCADAATRTITPTGVRSATLSPVATPGLVAQYSFNEGSGTVAHDVSGHGADAAIVGPAGWSTDSPIGGAGNYSLDLTGNVPHYSVPSTRWAEIPEASVALATDALTVAGWVKAGSGVLSVVVGKQLHGNYRDSFALFRTGGQWIFSIDSDVGGNQGIGFPSPDPADWTHAAGTFDGSFVRLYLNGALVASAAVPPGFQITYTGEPVTIGADYDIFGPAGSGVPDAGWPGLIDDVEIHNRALTGAEVAQLASRTAPPPPPPPSNDPATKDDCKNGGWKAYGFRNQGQCVRLVETGKDSR